MESVSKITSFGLKMMVKSGLEKNIFEIPPFVSNLGGWMLKIRKMKVSQIRQSF